MRRVVVLTALLGAAAFLMIGGQKAPVLGDRTVIVELFTSQG